MLTEYTISDIIISNPQKQFYYIGTFENTENPNVEWPHRHNFYSIVWFTESSGINVIDFDEYQIKCNRLFFVRPKQVHNWSYSKNSKGYILAFDKHLINFSIDLINNSFVDLSKKDIQLFKYLFENLINESKKKDNLSKKIIVSGIHYLLNNLIRLTSLKNQKIKPKLILKFSKLVAENISKNLSVKDYATKLHLTVERLNNICKDNYGQNPKAIILDKKITEAKRLLYFTELSIKEISFHLGFEDSSYFSRIFKKKTGFSPTKFKST